MDGQPAVMSKNRECGGKRFDDQAWK